jgi:hypothetical protein
MQIKVTPEAAPAGTDRTHLFFAERSHELVVQGLEQIGQHRALAGLDIGLDRHARRQLDVAKPLQLIVA